jgi:predicted small secreted protein
MRPTESEPDAGRRFKVRAPSVQEITMKLFKQFLALAMITVALTSLTACNTVHGAGKDIERGGEHLQDASH